MSRARFCGTITVGEKFFREGTTAGGYPYRSVNFGIKAGTNIAYVEAFACKMPVIKTMDTDNKPIEIKYADANDADVIDTVASYRKHTINLDGETREQFIADYDFVGKIIENIDEMKGKKFIVTASSSPNVYEGKVSLRWQIQNIYLADEDAKESLKITTDFYFDKDSVDGTDFADDKKVYLNGYISEYFSKNDLNADKGGARFIPQQIVLDANKIDFSNEKHIKLLNFKLKMLGINPIEAPDDKIKSKLKNGYYSLGCEFNYVNGAQEIDFSYDELTDMQKEMVDMGLKEVKDFAPAGSIYGARVTEWKLVNFSTSSKYADGMIEEDDIEDMIFNPITKVESLSDLDKVIEESNDELDDLFD